MVKIPDRLYVINLINTEGKKESIEFTEETIALEAMKLYKADDYLSVNMVIEQY